MGPARDGRRYYSVGASSPNRAGAGHAWADSPNPHGREVLVLERRETRIVDAVLGEFRGQECKPACVQGGPQAPRVALGVRHVRKSGE